MNLEVKAPHIPSVKELYNYKLCVEKVYELICQYQIQMQCCVSSFDRDVLKHLEHIANINNDKVQTIYLYNFYDHEALPDPSIYCTNGDGINISSLHLTHEVVDNCRRYGKKVGVWIDKSYTKESKEVYRKVLSMGVDFFCTDYPELLIEEREIWMNEQGDITYGESTGPMDDRMTIENVTNSNCSPIVLK